MARGRVLMLIWIKSKKSQRKIALIFAVVLIVIFIVINHIIRKMIENTSEITVQTSKAPSVTKKDISPSQEIFRKEEAPLNENTPKKDSATTYKLQNTPKAQDKEIIYEPSIKEHILLQ